MVLLDFSLHEVKEDPDFNAADESAVSAYSSSLVFLFYVSVSWLSQNTIDTVFQGDSHNRAQEEATYFKYKVEQTDVIEELFVSPGSCFLPYFFSMFVSLRTAQMQRTFPEAQRHQEVYARHGWERRSDSQLIAPATKSIVGSMVPWSHGAMLRQWLWT